MYKNKCLAKLPYNYTVNGTVESYALKYVACPAASRKVVP